MYLRAQRLPRIGACSGMDWLDWLLYSLAVLGKKMRGLDAWKCLVHPSCGNEELVDGGPVSLELSHNDESFSRLWGNEMTVLVGHHLIVPGCYYAVPISLSTCIGAHDSLIARL